MEVAVREGAIAARGCGCGSTPERATSTTAHPAGALAGLGAPGALLVATRVDLASDLPLVLEWVDTPERVTRLLPELEAMLQGGLITSEPVTIHRYQPHAERKR